MKQLLDYLDYDFREGFDLVCFAILLRNSTDNYLWLFAKFFFWATHRVQIDYCPL